MLDSGTKQPENRIHLFDPVGLINDGYNGYRSSNYAAKPRKPTKSYSNFEDINTNNGGVRSYDSYKEESSVVGLRGYDSFTDHSNNEVGLRSYESFSMETNGGGIIRSYEHNNNIEENRSNRENNVGGLRFTVVDNKDLDDEGEISTPRLWNNNKPTNSPSSSSSSSSSSFSSPMNNSHTKSHPSKSLNLSPLHPQSVKPMMKNESQSVTSLYTTSTSKTGSLSPLHQYGANMSPSSRTQAIVKGRRELMDMVRDLPESFYELSLKDIVEQKSEMEVIQKEIDIPEDKRIVVNKEINSKSKTSTEVKKQRKSGKKVKKSESKKKMVRSKSVDNGRFLLRTSVFPIFTGSKKNKKNLVGSNSFKVAPMPKPMQPTSNGSLKVGEKDWWRRKSCISSESDDTNGLSSKSESSGSSSSSSLSSSSNGRRGNRFLPSCCLFNGRKIRSKK